MTRPATALREQARYVDGDQLKEYDYHYGYDAMGRQILVDGVKAYDKSAGLNDSLISLAQGHLLAHDYNGNRIGDRGVRARW